MAEALPNGPRLILAEPSIEPVKSMFQRGEVGLSFRVRGISLACVRQVLLTDRFGATRGTLLVEDVAFVFPPELRDLPSSSPERGIFLTQCVVAMAGHKALSELLKARGVPEPEVAASCLLPECLEAHLLFLLRPDKFMEWLNRWWDAPEGNQFSEFRRLVCLVAQFVQSSAPDLVGAFSVDLEALEVRRL